MAPDDDLWAAVADPSRRRVLDLLVRDGEATASSLAARLPLSRQAVSKHLGVLEAAGLLERRRHGREVRYRVVPAQLDAATRALAELATDWSERLAALKRLAEAQGAADANAS
ncbi:MAG TPA: metalloregulator ArsR/SmtB family transcription factor [Acidimicrobiales bacterium]|nr:metalloregulator ArsR/SmtB family transcription factor [Acidimicrobiales bacterium]